MIQRLLFIVILIMAVSGCALRHCTPDGAMAVGRNDAALWHGDKPGLARAADCTKDFSPLAFEDNYRAGFQKKLQYECTTAAAASQGASHGASGRLLDDNFTARWALCEEVGVSRQVMSGAYRASYRSRYCDPARFEALGKAQPERFTPLAPVLLDPCPPDVRVSLKGAYKAGYQSRYCIAPYFAARGASMGEALLEPQPPPLEQCPPKKRDMLRQSYEAAYDAGFNYACSPVSATIKGEEDGLQGFASNNTTCQIPLVSRPPAGGAGPDLSAGLRSGAATAGEGTSAPTASRAARRGPESTEATGAGRPRRCITGKI